MKRLIVLFVLFAGLAAVAFANYSNNKKKAAIEKKVEKKEMKKKCKRTCMFS